MYSLKVKKSFTASDGRLFLEGHDVKSLNAFEVSELVTDYPEHFESADEETTEFLNNVENVKHLSDAVKRQKQEQGITGNLTTRKK